MPDVTDGLEVVVACSSHSPDMAVERQTAVMLTRDHTVLPATHTFLHIQERAILPLLPAAEHRRTLAGTHLQSR